MIKFYLSVCFCFLVFSYPAFADTNQTSSAEKAATEIAAVKEVLSEEELFKRQVLKIEELEVKIKTKFKEIGFVRGEELTLLSIQILEFEKEIADEIDKAASLLIKLKERRDDLGEQTKVLHRHINRRNKQLLLALNFIEKHIDELRSESSKLKNEDLFLFEQKVNKARNAMVSSILSYEKNILLKKELKLDTQHDDRVISDLLLKLSEALSTRITLVSNDIKAKKKVIAESTAENIGGISVEMNALVERRTGLTQGLSVLIKLMQAHDLETAELSQLLIKTSGTINEQIFDLKVISGLFENWINDFEKWVSLNASGFVVSSLLIILILIVFRVISIIVSRLLIKSFKNSRVRLSKLLQEFFVSSARRLIMVIGFLIALSQAGVELGPLLAGMGVLGFIVGFALQGVLSNFASGLMILVYRPFDVGDVIEVTSVLGTVKEMSLVSTTLLTFSNEKLIIPNNNIWGSTIKNITSEKQRRIDMVFKVALDADLEQVEGIFEEQVQRHEAVLADPAPLIKLHKQYETHLEYIVRPWTDTNDYWPTYWDLNRSINDRLNKEGVPRLFPFAFLKAAVESK